MTTAPFKVGNQSRPSRAPAGGLTAAVGFAAFHSVARIVGKRRYEINFSFGEIVQLAAADAKNAAIAAHPKIVRIVFQNPRNNVVEQAVFRAVMRKFPVLQAIQPAAVSS
jgi:hypothetical protein